MTAKKNSPAKIAYNNKWTNANFDRINIAVKKGDKTKYQAEAVKAGLSLNAWIVSAMAEKAENSSSISTKFKVVKADLSKDKNSKALITQGKKDVKENK